MTPPDPREDAGLSLAAFVLTAVWAALLVVSAVPDVFYDSLGGRASPDLFFTGIFALAIGFNMWLAALVLGIVAVARYGSRRLLRACLLAALLVGGLVGALNAEGVQGGSGDDDEVTLTHETVRGLAVWAIAAVVVVASRWLLRGRPSARPFQSSQPEALVLWGSVATFVAGIVSLAYVAGRPGVYIHNNSDEAVMVQICPRQDCGEGASRVGPGSTKHFRLEHRDEEIPDSARFLRGDTLVGCLLIVRDDELPNNIEYAVSEADLETC